jgi:hypothetical protein
MKTYRRNNPINKTIGITFLLLLLALSITGYSYSHWTKTITIQGTITTAKAQLIITSHKLLIPDITNFNTTHQIHYYVTPDNLTLVADCKNVTGAEWTIKIGLIVKNNGTMPIDLTETTITFNITTTNFNVTTYYYNFNSAYWDDTLTFSNVPPLGNVTPPIQLEPNDQAITWTIINLFDTTQIVDIQIIATPEFHPYP